MNANDRIVQLEARITELETTVGMMMLTQMAMNQRTNNALKTLAHSLAVLLEVASGDAGEPPENDKAVRFHA